PVVLTIPQRLRGQTVSREIFIGELGLSFFYPEVVPSARILIATLLLVAVLVGVFLRYIKPDQRAQYLSQWMTISLTFIASFWLLRLTLSEIGIAVDEALAAGTPVPIWSYIIFISAGAGLVGFALWLWTSS